MRKMYPDDLIKQHVRGHVPRMLKERGMEYVRDVIARRNENFNFLGKGRTMQQFQGMLRRWDEQHDPAVIAEIETKRKERSERGKAQYRAKQAKHVYEMHEFAEADPLMQSILEPTTRDIAVAVAKRRERTGQPLLQCIAILCSARGLDLEGQRSVLYYLAGCGANALGKSIAAAEKQELESDKIAAELNRTETAVRVRCKRRKISLKRLPTTSP